MLVEVECLEPVQQKDGSWKVIRKKVMTEYNDLGRETKLCNSCGFEGYPECKKWCDNWKK